VKLQWWCSAVGVSWSWTWRAYPGVWLFVIACAIAYALHLRRIGPDTPGSGMRRSARIAFFAIGLLFVWAALDWPIGALGGYLASAHMAQFLILAITAPALILLGMPRREPRPRGRVTRILTHPVVAIAIFAAVVFATHLPVVTDSLMPSQVGSFAIDIAWLGSGLLFWLPVISNNGPAWFGPPVRMVYLFANMVLMTAPGAMITFSELPIYATFELAPRIPGIEPASDQRLAGLNMRVGAALVTWIAISILFLRWTRDEERQMRDEARAAGLMDTDSTV
jgi:putative membrane protein